MTRPARFLTLAAAAVLALGTRAAAQDAPAQPDPAVDAATRMAVIDALVAALDEAYVFPETANEMEQDLRARAGRGEYDGITGSQAFADALTEHLQGVSRDKHLRVRYSARPLPVQQPDREPTAEQRRRRQEQLRAINYGFDRVERLAGNVGYLELRGFTDAELGEETVAAAMTFLANSDALIVDLRRNGGGSPQMVALISSYLFGPEPVHLNSLYWRPEDRTDHFHTRAEVKGRRLGPDVPVYVLTSNRTFSAAEEFTYNLKNLERATIVGETTGGGAHPGGMRRLSDHFHVFVPSGRAISPITGTNWEGTGVTPHVAVPADDALRTAHLDALRKLEAQATDPERKQALQRAIREVEGEHSGS